jgi:hypothetical protein
MWTSIASDAMTENLKTILALVSFPLSLWAIWTAHRAQKRMHHSEFRQAKEDLAARLERNTMRADLLAVEAQFRLDEFARILKEKPMLDGPRVQDRIQEMRGLLHLVEAFREDEQYTPEEFRNYEFSNDGIRRIYEIRYLQHARGQRLDQPAWDIVLTRSKDLIDKLDSWGSRRAELVLPRPNHQPHAGRFHRRRALRQRHASSAEPNSIGEEARQPQAITEISPASNMRNIGGT